MRQTNEWGQNSVATRVNFTLQNTNRLIGEFKDKNKDWKYRYLVLIQLAYTKDERVIKPAIESLKDESDEIRDRQDRGR